MSAFAEATDQIPTSARRRRPVYTDDALNDLEEILFFTKQQWGKSQQSAYRRIIREAIRTLGAFPYLGTLRDGILPGMRSHPAGSHIVYYWIDDGIVTVARILHSSRDTSRISWAKSTEDIDPTKSP